jgi:hypothetical protein
MRVEGELPRPNEEVQFRVGKYWKIWETRMDYVK